MISCAGGETIRRPVALPSAHTGGWYARPQGIAYLGGRPVALYAPHLAGGWSEDTHVAVWAPGSGTVQYRVIEGDIRLHPGSEEVWIVNNELEPQVLRLDPGAFLDLLSPGMKSGAQHPG